LNADQEDAGFARKYFTSGAHMGSRSSRHAEDGKWILLNEVVVQLLILRLAEFERERPEVMMRLREQVLAKLEDERWMYEPAERHMAGGP
jgi:hypothetical protein